MSAIKFLVTLVALCLCLNGCHALTGCPGSPQCDPNWVNDADGDNNADGGSVSSTNDGSVTETATVETAPTVQEVCKDFMYLEGMSLACHWGGYDFSCTLALTVLESGACGVRCPTHWKIPANIISFPSSDKMMWDEGEGSGPHTCDKVK